MIRRDWSFLWPYWGWLCPEPSLGPRADNVIIPLDLTQLFYPGFTLAAGPLSGFTTDRVGCWGGALWRACYLTSFPPCLTGPVDYLTTTRDPSSKPLGGLMWNQDSPVSVVSLKLYKEWCQVLSWAYCRIVGLELVFLPDSSSSLVRRLSVLIYTWLAWDARCFQRTVYLVRCVHLPLIPVK